MDKTALYNHHYNLLAGTVVKTATQLDAQVGQLLLPGVGSAGGAYMGEGTENQKIRRARLSGLGGLAGSMLGGLGGFVAAGSPRSNPFGLPNGKALLGSLVGGQVGAAVGYNKGDEVEE